jgi:hypothetical protein
MTTNKLEMTTEVAALETAMRKQRDAMNNLNVSYGGKNGGINRWNLNTANEQLAENLEIIAFYENLLNEAKAATAELQSTIHAMPELIAYEKAEYAAEYAQA